jgi:electron transfer flavoprotein alpha subunit
MPASIYTAEEERKTICVYLEHTDDTLEGVAVELLGKARLLADQAGWSLAGLVCGNEVGHLTGLAIAHGADEVWLAEHPLLAEFTVDAFAQVAFSALMQGKPSVFLAGATPNGRDLAGRLAVRLRTGLNADCTDLRFDTTRGVLVSEVTGFGGGVLALLEMPDHRPQMATVRAGVFPAGEPDSRRTGRVIQVPIDLHAEAIHTKVIERVLGQRVDLTQAGNLVCGGRGVNGDFSTLERLAQLVGGEVGATRPPVDEGLVGRERQVGQTGVVCRPKVALACGISGAFHFVVGIQNAGTVVAINTDPEAAIFEFSDYCVVGDVSSILPALIEAIERQRETTHA